MFQPHFSIALLLAISTSTLAYNKDTGEMEMVQAKNSRPEYN